MLLQKDSKAQAEAVVAFAYTEAAEALTPQFDAAFGSGGWVSTRLKEAKQAIRKVAEDGGIFLVIGVQSESDQEIDAAREVIADAKLSGLKVILLAESLSPSTMHALMRAGADDFAPLPLPTSALNESISRLRVGAQTPFGGSKSRNGGVYPIYGAAGGVGATTFSVNLAWETALEVAKSGKQVALLDFNFQYGTVATYLDLPRREAIYELLSDTSTMDEEGLSQALATYENRMSVLTAPMDVLPYDIIGPEDVRSLLDLARLNYDYIFVDLPQTLTHWSDLVLSQSEQFYALMQSDMRSAQNMLRFLRAVRSEELPIEKVTVCLNKAPSFSDLSGKTRVRRLEQSLDVEFQHRLPDGGKQIPIACDQGTPLARAAKNNALRKEIRKIAQGIVARSAADQKMKAGTV
ncbi:MAG: AAA family ATPase [Pseudomonadota bacterium]